MIQRRPNPWWFLLTISVALGLGACGTRPDPAAAPTRVLLIGVESLSLEFVNERIDAGELPNLARLIRGGTRAKVMAPDPLQTSTLWATALTGKSTSGHQMTAQLVQMPNSGEVTLAPSSMRTAKSLFQIASDEAISVAQIGFPGSWPAEVVNGQNVAYGAVPARWLASSEHSFERQRGQMATFPTELFREIEPFLHEGEPLPRENASRFFTLNEMEFERLYDEPLGSIYRRENPLRDFAITLQRDLSQMEIAEYVSRTYHPRLLGVHLELLESLQPSYWGFARPDLYGIPGQVGRRFDGTIAEGYRWLDEQIGRLLDELPPQSVVCIVGNRGFGDGTLPPATADGTPQAAPVVKNETLLVLWGQGIAAGQDLGAVQLADLTPTLLTILDAPVGADMQGAVLDRAFTREFAGAHPKRVVESLDAGWDQNTRYPSNASTTSPEDD